MEREPIVALDFPTWEISRSFLEKMDTSLFVKVGMELYLQNGPMIIEELKKMNHRIFLDLKLHDIPNTVGRAMKGLAQLEIDLINVHAAGGVQMMEHALNGLVQGTPSGKERPMLISVTQLTSTSEEQMKKEQLINQPLINSVLHYAKISMEAGLDGVVCSPHEAAAIRELSGEDFLRVTPGIRLLGDATQDQKRIASPSQARQLGSSAIVVGRSITEADDPAKAYLKVKSEWEGQV
ncbi:orotidine-5'-phosphate decarboxylase [Rossellomorea vietnamensis]|uniref:Orotidine 5'-phosphate decarboxylase n=1 Tax=Rossellomorea vietnamensis TaxID=218284 RepID=A0A5D4MES9_9BACI|nr:orotidine-5'-phosphate decarboxylase [Rossellomorea vietnamensis]TYS00077.1 orotidine-5'-phosphate decarboxylase [Rossellomorea vietnamensis]